MQYLSFTGRQSHYSGAEKEYHILRQEINKIMNYNKFNSKKNCKI